MYNVSCLCPILAKTTQSSMLFCHSLFVVQHRRTLRSRDHLHRQSIAAPDPYYAHLSSLPLQRTSNVEALLHAISFIANDSPVISSEVSPLSMSAPMFANSSALSSHSPLKINLLLIVVEASAPRPPHHQMFCVTTQGLTLALGPLPRQKIPNGLPALFRSKWSLWVVRVPYLDKWAPGNGRVFSVWVASWKVRKHECLQIQKHIEETSWFEQECMLFKAHVVRN